MREYTNVGDNTLATNDNHLPVCALADGIVDCLCHLADLLGSSLKLGALRVSLLVRPFVNPPIHPFTRRVSTGKHKLVGCNDDKTILLSNMMHEPQAPSLASLSKHGHVEINTKDIHGVSTQPVEINTKDIQTQMTCSCVRSTCAVHDNISSNNIFNRGRR